MIVVWWWWCESRAMIGKFWRPAWKFAAKPTIVGFVRGKMVAVRG